MINNKYTNNLIQHIQKKGLLILCEFHNICEQYNLSYILDYGTLLGAIRHEGFIPWDDDVDVAMPRKDFEKFVELSTDNLPENMFLQTHSTDPNYFLPFAKIRLINNEMREKEMAHLDIKHGPWIDIFVYDYIFDSEHKNSQIVKKFNKNIKFKSLIMPYRTLKDYTKIDMIKTNVKNVLIKVLSKAQKLGKRSILFNYFDYKFLKLITLVKELPKHNKSGQMMTFSFMIDEKDSIESLSLNERDFKNRKLITFEEKEFYIPANFKNILINRYDNYKELPPKDERVPSHNFISSNC